MFKGHFISPLFMHCQCIAKKIGKVRSRDEMEMTFLEKKLKHAKKKKNLKKYVKLGKTGQNRLKQNKVTKMWCEM